VGFRDDATPVPLRCAGVVHREDEHLHISFCATTYAARVDYLIVGIRTGYADD